MSATGYTTGDPQKVDVTGDSMTGDLTLAGSGTDLSVGGNLSITGSSSFTGPITGTFDVSGTLLANYQGVDGEVMRLLSTAIATGLTSGGMLSISADPTKVDIAAATGWVVDFDSTSGITSSNPTITFVNYAGQTGVSPLGTLATYYLLDSTGTVLKQSTPPTRAQTRTSMFLGASIQFGGTVVAVRNLPMVQSQPGAQLVDLMAALGAFNVGFTSNSITANGVNLKINTNGGDLFIRAYGVNVGTYLNPHIATLSAQTPCTFRYATATTLLSPFVTDIDVANYDPNGSGTVTAIGGGANTSTIHRVFISGAPLVNEQIIIQYGQSAHASLATAQAAIGRGTFIVNPLFTGSLTGYVIATRTATDLSDPAQATFIRAGKFDAP